MNFTQENYSIHKFGGSSLADANRFKNVKSLLAGKKEIVVVSAVKEVTGLLQSMLDEAKKGHPVAQGMMEIEHIHTKIAKELLPEQKYQAIITCLKQDLSQIDPMLQTVRQLGLYSKEIQDVILGYGEQWSAKILTAYFSEFQQTLYLDAATVLFTYHHQGMLCIDWQQSQRALEQFLQHKTFDQLVITGFIAATKDGKRTTLGRNGSDFSAAIFAKLFNAQSLCIWTDVDGIFTADPNRVRAAFAIESLSYKEALELAYFGAKVLHPMTIAPAFDSQIPIYIKNSLKPAAKGTYISHSSEHSDYGIKGITSMDEITLINIEGAGMLGTPGYAARIFQVLQQIHISVILISQSSSEHSLCLAIATPHSDRAIQAITEHFQHEIATKQIEKIQVDNACAILAVVGDEMIGAIGVAGKLCSILANANINIRAIAQGTSERNISVVIQHKEINKALQAVHAGFYLSNKTIAIGLIGPGSVGATLLKQISAASKQLKASNQINLFVRSIMDSKKMLLSHESDLANHWQERLEQTATSSNLQTFIDHLISDHVPHAVIIDCTANPEIAALYPYFLQQGIHVITPNKHLNGGDILQYKKVKALSLEKNCQYLYEATVCAGLPILNTIHDLLKTGDEITAIEGVVSGTLSYIFSELAKGKLFSEVVWEAKKRGFTEPDPREDLSGMDVARKLVCLGREIGHDVSLADIDIHNLVPEELKSCSVEMFLEKLPLYDHAMQELFAKAQHKNEKLYYMGAIDQHGKIRVAIDAVPEDHPFTRLTGTDNMLIFHTKRYHEQPLIIQGPGAGAEVTAAGIFADLLRLASSLS